MMLQCTKKKAVKVVHCLRNVAKVVFIISIRFRHHWRQTLAFNMLTCFRNFLYSQTRIGKILVAAVAVVLVVILLLVVVVVVVVVAAIVVAAAVVVVVVL